VIAKIVKKITPPMTRLKEIPLLPVRQWD